MSLQATGKVSNVMLQYATQLASFLGCGEETALRLIQTRGNELAYAKRMLTNIFGDSFKGMTTNQIATFVKGLDSSKIETAKKMQELGILKDYYKDLNSVELQKIIAKTDKKAEKALKTNSIFSYSFNQNGQTASLA